MGCTKCQINICLLCFCVLGTILFAGHVLSTVNRGKFTSSLVHHFQDLSTGCTLHWPLSRLGHTYTHIALVRHRSITTHTHTHTSDIDLTGRGNYFKKKSPFFFLSRCFRGRKQGSKALSGIILFYFVRWVPKNRKKRYFHRFGAYFGFQPAKYRISKPPNSQYYVPGPQLHAVYCTGASFLPWGRFYITL